jgi:hypothetical protein
MPMGMVRNGYGHINRVQYGSLQERSNGFSHDKKSDAGHCNPSGSFF